MQSLSVEQDKKSHSKSTSSSKNKIQNRGESKSNSKKGRKKETPKHIGRKDAATPLSKPTLTSKDDKKNKKRNTNTNTRSTEDDDDDTAIQQHKSTIKSRKKKKKKGDNFSLADALFKKPPILPQERIRVLIQVFEKGSEKLSIQPNEHKVKELKWLLGLTWETDSACWIPGSTLRAKSSEDVKANCYVCQTTLTFRHHCRRCGTLVCDSCSQERCNLKVYWDEDSEYKPCLRVLSTEEDRKRAPKKMRTCDRCITQMLEQEKFGQGNNAIKQSLHDKDSKRKEIDGHVDETQHNCSMCGNILPLNNKWHHPEDSNRHPSESNYWKIIKESSSSKTCVNCVLEKRHAHGYLHTYDITINDIHPLADSMDIQDAIERIYPFSVQQIQFSLDSATFPRKNEKGNISCTVTLIDVITRNALLKIGKLQVLVPCGLQENALVRVFARASTKEQLKKLGEPTYGFFRSNKIGYSDMIFIRKNVDSYVLKYKGHEKTFPMNQIVISGRRPTEDSPGGARMESGFCFVAVACVSSKSGIQVDHDSILSMARQKVDRAGDKKHTAKLDRSKHRAHGHDFRCIGMADCVPDARKKQYCMTCGGVRFSRDDMLQSRTSTSNAVRDAIRQDDVVRLRACVLLKGMQVKNTTTSKTIDTGGFFIDLQSIQGPLGTTPIHMCCEYEAQECLHFLLRLQSSQYHDMMKWTDANGATPLHVAARVGFGVATLCRGSGSAAPTVTTADVFGMLPIHYAALRCDFSDLKELLQSGSQHDQLFTKDHTFKSGLDFVNEARTGKDWTQCASYLQGQMDNYKLDLKMMKK